MRSEDIRLDGNSAAGPLRELFANDMTAARATCSGCGGTNAFGALIEYGGAMGVILRCPACETAMLRMARTGASLRVDFSGLSFVVVEA
jgi:hypothetical protein